MILGEDGGGGGGGWRGTGPPVFSELAYLTLTDALFMSLSVK